MRKDLLRLDFPVKDALDEPGANSLLEIARYIAMLLRVHLDLLQEQLPHLEQAVWAMESDYGRAYYRLWARVSRESLKSNLPLDCLGLLLLTFPS